MQRRPRPSGFRRATRRADVERNFPKRFLRLDNIAGTPPIACRKGKGHGKCANETFANQAWAQGKTGLLALAILKIRRTGVLRCFSVLRRPPGMTGGSGFLREMLPDVARAWARKCVPRV